MVPGHLFKFAFIPTKTQENYCPSTAPKVSAGRKVCYIHNKVFTHFVCVGCGGLSSLPNSRINREREKVNAGSTGQQFVLFASKLFANMRALHAVVVISFPTTPAAAPNCQTNRLFVVRGAGGIISFGKQKETREERSQRAYISFPFFFLFKYLY